MAIEVLTGRSSSSTSSSTGISPRISFSHDLKNKDGIIPVEDHHHHHHHRRSDLCLLDSTSDFVFSITNVITQQLSSADELFSNGKIVPMEIKTKTSHQSPPLPQPQPIKCTQKKKLKEFLSANDAENEEEEEEEEKPSLKYFWKFNRSSSLNFDTTRRNSLIRSLQFLSRSNSTGSAPNPKQKQRFQKQSPVSGRRSLSSSSTSSSSSSTYYFYRSASHKSSSLTRNYGSSYGNNGVRISPVLNLPQAYIPKATARFFGFGSLFCNGKIKRKNK